MAEIFSQPQATFYRLRAGQGASFLLYPGVGLFILVLIATVGIFVLNRAQEMRREEFIVQNRAKEENLRPELLNQITLLEGRLKGVTGLLANHVFTSNVFKVIEANSHPQVRFLNFNFAADSLKVDMSGEAASYSVLARQIGIFERESQVERVEFGGLSATSEGLVGFKLSLIFKPTLLHLRQ